VRTLLTDPRTDPNRENLHNTTPLILAAGNGQMEVRALVRLSWPRLTSSHRVQCSEWVPQ
jgi:hypothetical protein